MDVFVIGWVDSVVDDVVVVRGGFEVYGFGGKWFFIKKCEVVYLKVVVLWGGFYELGVLFEYVCRNIVGSLIDINVFVVVCCCCNFNG